MAHRDMYLQALRGIGISAVVLIHCLPAMTAATFIRPFLNFSVALFIFLSGYLTRMRREFTVDFFSKRITKILIPYCVWSVMYSLAKGAPEELMYNLLTGEASAQLYYLLVYAQLVLLTPLFKLGLERKPVIVYSISPIFILLHVINTRYALFPYVLPASSCVYWVLFYIVGLDWDRCSAFMKSKFTRKHLFFALIFSLMIQIAIGYLWNSIQATTIATTQLKVTSALTTFITLLYFMNLPDRIKERLSGCRALTQLGDCSFGIYLCHTGILVVLQSILGRILAIGLCQSFVLWMGTLLCSLVLVKIATRLLPYSLRSLIGFV